MRVYIVVGALLVIRVHKRFEELVADACEMVRIMRLRAEQWDVTLVQAGRIVQIVQNRIGMPMALPRNS
jgi:hypothetical protein